MSIKLRQVSVLLPLTSRKEVPHGVSSQIRPASFLRKGFSDRSRIRNKKCHSKGG
jgi:hypothetical protein